MESMKENSSAKSENKDLNKNLVSKDPPQNANTEIILEQANPLSIQSPIEQRREAERLKFERERMSKKLDEVFGVIRSESVDDIKTEIKVRKTTVEHNKMDEYEQKRVARQQISMPEKPAT